MGKVKWTIIAALYAIDMQPMQTLQPKVLTCSMASNKETMCLILSTYVGTVYFSSPLYRKNLHYRVLPKASSAEQVLRDITSYITDNHPNDSGIIYCFTKKVLYTIWLHQSILSHLPRTLSMLLEALWSRATVRSRLVYTTRTYPRLKSPSCTKTGARAWCKLFAQR